MSESGSVTNTYTYDAFGNLLKSTGRTENNYRYCGEQFDSTTGLYYLRARYMDTSTGRFISQDSYAGSVYDPVSLHKYLYANSNPVTYSDPSGYMSLGETMCVSAIIGGTCGAFINVAGYLDMLVGWRDFNFNDMLQAAFEGFLEGMTYGLLLGVAFYGLSYLCVLIPTLTGLDTAIGYTLGIYGVSKALTEARSAYKSGNYVTAFCYTVLAVISGKLLFDSIYGNFSNEIHAVAARAKATTDTSTGNAQSSTNNSSTTQIDNQKVIDSATKSNKGGESVVGHALQKHSGRNPDIWGKVTGGPEQINQTALQHLNEILNAPGEFTKVQAPNGVYFLEKVLPDGRGVRLNMDGTFKGFIDQ